MTKTELNSQLLTGEDLCMSNNNRVKQIPAMLITVEVEAQECPYRKF